eukprot:8172_1
MLSSIGQLKKKSKMKNFIKSKFAKYKRNKNKDDFIIKFSATNNKTVNNEQLNDERRLVFVSLIGLYQTYQNCTPMQLYYALFIVPLKRKWIYEPNKYQQEFTFLSQFQDTTKNEEFIQLLRWKDSQGTIFWMIDNYKNNKKDQHVNTVTATYTAAPFWKNLSKILVTLYDP